MTARTWLRIASLFSLLQGLAHALLAARFKPMHSPAEVVVIAGLGTQHFPFSHALHSYWQMYTGYQIFVIVACLVQAALIWDLGPLAIVAPRQLRPALLVLTFANLVYAVLTIRYFFALAAVFDLLIAILLLAAWGAAHRPARRV